MTVNPPPPIQLVVPQAQLITAALMAGALMFAGVTLAIGGQKMAGVPAEMQYAGLGAGVAMLHARTWLPSTVAKAQLKRVRQLPAEEVSRAIGGVYLSQTILGNALLEGAAFFNLVCYQLLAQVSNLAMAAVMLVVMACTFPTKSQLIRWAERVQRDELTSHN